VVFYASFDRILFASFVVLLYYWLNILFLNGGRGFRSFFTLSIFIFDLGNSNSFATLSLPKKF
jgi:hypothetical protein